MPHLATTNIRQILDAFVKTGHYIPMEIIVVPALRNVLPQHARHRQIHVVDNNRPSFITI